VRIPNGGGKMIAFKPALLMRLPKTRVLSEVDDNKKLTLTLEEDEYEFLMNVQNTMQSSMIDAASLAKCDFSPSIVRSEASGKPYIKVKVQTLGFSATLGMDVNNRANPDTLSLLGARGSEGNFMLRIEGVYIGASYCGLVIKVDMFRLTKVPSDKDIEQAKEDFASQAVEDRQNLFSIFTQDEKPAKKSRKN